MLNDNFVELCRKTFADAHAYKRVEIFTRLPSSTGISSIFLSSSSSFPLSLVLTFSDTTEVGSFKLGSLEFALFKFGSFKFASLSVASVIFNSFVSGSSTFVWSSAKVACRLTRLDIIPSLAAALASVTSMQSSLVS